MSTKKLTPAIAKALAEKVRAELLTRTKGTAEALKKKVESSKLYKELLLTTVKERELEEKKASLKTEIENTFSTKINDVSISGYGNSEPHVYIREHVSSSVESIKDLILIEDYMSDNTMTSDEFIKFIADKLSK
jgi:hypothetical protein